MTVSHKTTGHGDDWPHGLLITTGLWLVTWTM